MTKRDKKDILKVLYISFFIILALKDHKETGDFLYTIRGIGAPSR